MRNKCSTLNGWGGINKDHTVVLPDLQYYDTPIKMILLLCVEIPLLYLFYCQPTSYQFVTLNVKYKILSLLE